MIYPSYLKTIFPKLPVNSLHICSISFLTDAQLRLSVLFWVTFLWRNASSAAAIIISA